MICSASVRPRHWPSRKQVDMQKLPMLSEKPLPEAFGVSVVVHQATRVSPTRRPCLLQGAVWECRRSHGPPPPPTDS